MVHKVIGFAIGVGVSIVTIGVTIYAANYLIGKASPGTRPIGLWGSPTA